MYHVVLVKIHSSPKPSSFRGAHGQLSGGQTLHTHQFWEEAREKINRGREISPNQEVCHNEAELLSSEKMTLGERQWECVHV